MLEWVHMITLAVVQGLTEFLPISSSGHLVLLQHLLGTRMGDLLFDVVLHCGTLGSVLVFYRREIRRLLRFDAPALRYLLNIAIGTIPAAVFGLTFRTMIESLFLSPWFVGAGLVLSAVALYSTRATRAPRATAPQAWEPMAIHPLRCLLIGAFQALAILPGVSRSGMTISASLWSGLERAEAARFSFLLSIPAITGALVVQLSDGVQLMATQWAVFVVVALVSFAVGLLALRWTAMAVVQAHFWKFSIYCVVLGAIVLLVMR